MNNKYTSAILILIALALSIKEAGGLRAGNLFQIVFTVGLYIIAYRVVIHFYSVLKQTMNKADNKEKDKFL